MRHSYRTLIAATIVAAGSALAAGAALANDTDGMLLAANEAVMRHEVQIPAHSAATSAAVTAAQEQEMSPAAYGADPDPSKFDRAGLEIWWAKYSKAHPGSGEHSSQN